MECLWPDGKKKWFLAKIKRVNDDDNTYDILFLDDNQSLDKVKAYSIKKVGNRCQKLEKGLVSKVFYDPGPRRPTVTKRISLPVSLLSWRLHSTGMSVSSKSIVNGSSLTMMRRHRC